MTSLDIISDPVCPWCFIGAANLTRALAEREPHPFAIRWRAFELNPDMPAEGMDRRDYLDAKFGGRENAERIYAQVEEAAKAAGLDIDFASIRRAPNTLDAQRVIHWAEAEGRQTAVAMALFRRYFERGDDISDPAVLRATGEEAGLDGVVVARLLEGDADRDAVQTEATAARQMGVTGVPTFILGSRYAIVGAQPPETWTRVLDELAAAAGA